MTAAVDIIASEVAAVGYRDAAIVRDYSFADVLHAGDERRTVALAAFTQTPPSYRSAALAVVESRSRPASELINEYRALGAPLLFALDGDDVTVWQVGMEEPARRIVQTRASELPAIFAEHRDSWQPQAIHRAKAIGGLRSEFQLDFVDAGLLPAIEGEIHRKLDRLLEDALAAAKGLRRRSDQQALFRATFRFLAAKVLGDRDHPLAKKWDPSKVTTVLAGIENYYGLSAVEAELAPDKAARLSSVWDVISSGIDFRNISSDDLAFVYENTLVTPEARKEFGTHSTPRQVAEYVTDALALWDHDHEKLRVYEPFAGAGVFLVAALRRLREALPLGWDEQERHRYAVKRITGDEIDAFAREVATLSLILADYPNANGWKIEERDLFVEDCLRKRAERATVVLCNPPFEVFKPNERKRYPEASERDYRKAAFVLESVLDAKPEGIGFVLPDPAILGKAWQRTRNRVEDQYERVELVSLPDRIFEHSTVRSSLLIARTRRPAKSRRESVFVRSTTVAVQDREAFLATGKTTSTRTRHVPYVENRTGSLWIPELSDLWHYLENAPRLGTLVDVHIGLQWLYPQSEAVSTRRQVGFVRGLGGANDLEQFVPTRIPWLEFREEHVRRGWQWEWKAPKVIANTARRSRGPWCLAATVDEKGKLACSQQLFGIWPRKESRLNLYEIAAIINGPLANAYAAVHSEADRIRNHALENVPVPEVLPHGVGELARQYARAAAACQAHPTPDAEAECEQLLAELDAIVLAAYDLPPRLESALIEHFRGAERPVVHPWSHWLPQEINASFSLREILSAEFARSRSAWPVRVFRPLSEEDAEVFREYAE